MADALRKFGVGQTVIMRVLMGNGGDQEGAEELAGEILGEADAHVAAEPGHARAVAGVGIGSNGDATLPKDREEVEGVDQVACRQPALSFGLKAFSGGTFGETPVPVCRAGSARLRGEVFSHAACRDCHGAFRLCGQGFGGAGVEAGICGSGASGRAASAVRYCILAGRGREGEDQEKKDEIRPARRFYPSGPSPACALSLLFSRLLSKDRFLADQTVAAYVCDAFDRFLGRLAANIRKTSWPFALKV